MKADRIEVGRRAEARRASRPFSQALERVKAGARPAPPAAPSPNVPDPPPRTLARRRPGREPRPGSRAGDRRCSEHVGDLAGSVAGGRERAVPLEPVGPPAEGGAAAVTAAVERLAMLVQRSGAGSPGSTSLEMTLETGLRIRVIRGPQGIEVAMQGEARPAGAETLEMVEFLRARGVPLARVVVNGSVVWPRPPAAAPLLPR